MQLTIATIMLGAISLARADVDAMNNSLVSLLRLLDPIRFRQGRDISLEEMFPRQF